jgi:hypothetical protein
MGMIRIGNENNGLKVCSPDFGHPTVYVMEHECPLKRFSTLGSCNKNLHNYHFSLRLLQSTVNYTRNYAILISYSAVPKNRRKKAEYLF